MLFDEVRLEHESLDLVIDNDELEVSDRFYKLPRLRIMVAAGMEIRPNTIAQILGLSDVNYLPSGVFVNVDAGVGWELFQFVAYIAHKKNLTDRKVWSND